MGFDFLQKYFFVSGGSMHSDTTRSAGNSVPELRTVMKLIQISTDFVVGD